MKEETITLRVDASLKENFKKICDLEKTDMSDKLYKFINDEVKEKIPVDYENQIELFLKMFGYNNIHILKYPFAGKDFNGKIYQECCGSLSLMQTSILRLKDVVDFSNFLSKNEDKEIYIYLIGSNLPNEVKYFIIDKN